MRSDVDPTSADYVGRVKSLPINREIVLHRIGRPMALKGPFAPYSSGELLAAVPLL